MQEINRRKFLKLMGAVGVALPFSNRNIIAQIEDQRPNIVVIISDQHHPRIAGYLGHPLVKTPNLDRLADAGTSFSRTYCTYPVCGPSRVSMMTGKYAHQHGTWMNEVPTNPEIITWPMKLTEAGYHTGAIGKMDFAGKYQNPGFKEFHTFSHRAAFNPYPLNTPWDMRLRDYRRPVKRRILENSGPSQPVKREFSAADTVDDPLFRNSDSRYTGYYGHDREVTEHGIMFLRHRAKDITSRPWALYLGYLQPHWPYRVPQRYYDIYYPDRIEWPHDARFPNDSLHPVLKHFQDLLCINGLEEDVYRRAIAAYYGMVTCLDDLIGKVIEELKTQGIYENTVIIYSSDHGESLGEHGLFYKQCSYEGSAGVPLIIKGPGIPKGQRIDTPISGVDLYPTLMELTGLDTEEDVQGHSLLPLTRGDNSSYPEYSFSEFHGNFFPQSWYMLVKDGYKFTYYSDGMRPSLFNLIDDPQENRDLATDSGYSQRLNEFNDLLHTILDPESTALRSKQDLGLIGPSGLDYTKVLSWSEYKEGVESGRFPKLKLGFDY